MVEPLPELPVGSPDVGAFDRSEQAARFLDLARRHRHAPGDPPELIPLIAEHLHDALDAAADPCD